MRPTTRPMTTALFMLRCCQLGLSVSDLDELTIGIITDMAVERSNDDVKWNDQATQEDFDRF